MNRPNLRFLSLWLTIGIACNRGPTHDEVMAKPYHSTDISKEVYYLNDAPIDGAITTYHSWLGTQKKRETHYVDGLIDGVEEYWHSNGQLSKEIHWKQGLRNGPKKEWFPTGQIKSEITYKVKDKDKTTTTCCFNQQFWNDDGSKRLRHWQELMNDKDLLINSDSDGFVQQFNNQFSVSSFNKQCTAKHIRDLHTVLSSYLQYILIMNTPEATHNGWNINVGFLKKLLQIFLKTYQADEMQEMIQSGLIQVNAGQSTQPLVKKDCDLYLNYAVTYWHHDKLNLPPEAKK
jgi:hypothetical protein